MIAPDPARAHLAAMRAPGLRLLTWAPRRPAVLSESVRRQLDVLERAEQRARDMGDRIAVITYAKRIAHLLREG